MWRFSGRGSANFGIGNLRRPRIAVLTTAAALTIAAVPMASLGEDDPVRGVQAKAGGVGPEVPGMRTERSKTFLDPRGGYTTRIFPADVHFKDAGGEWRGIDNTLVEQGGELDNKAAAVDVDLPKKADAMARISRGGHSIAFALDGEGTEPSLRGASATYRGVKAGVDLRFTAQSHGLKEELVLTGESAPTEFTYRLDTSDGLTPRENDGGIDFEDADGELVAQIPAPFMHDESGEDSGYSDDVQLRLGRDDSDYKLTLEADAEWVKSPERVGPVTVDPTVVFKPPSPDCAITNTTPDTNYCSALEFDVGSNMEGTTLRKRRSLLRFTVKRWLPKGAEIFDAKLYAKSIQQRTTTPISVNVHDLSRSWTTGVTWNRHDGTNAWTTPGGDFNSTVVDNNPSVGGTLGWEAWRVTSSVQKWADGANSGQNDGGNGFLLKQADESVTTNDVDFATREVANSADWPHLDVWYDGLTGVMPYYGFEQEEPLTDRLGMRVNVASGNLILQENDLQIPGTALNFGWARFYNSREPVTDRLGWGWTGSVGPDIRLWSRDTGHVVMAGPTGWVKQFRSNGSGGYTKPAGVNATLTKHSDSTYTLTWNKSDDKWKFSSTGYLTEQVSKNGQKITFGYDASSRLTTVTDTRSRVTTFGYNANGRLATVTDPASRVHSYGYNTSATGEAGAGELMTTYTDPAGKATTYAYGGTSGTELRSVTDSTGRKTEFTYDGDRRIATVKRGILGTDPGYTTGYAYNQAGTKCPTTAIGNTVVTDPRGKKTTYCWDDKGRVDRVFDALGRERSQKYDSNSNVTFATGTQGTTAGYGSTGTYDSNDNLKTIEQPGTGGQTGQKSLFNYDPTGTAGNVGANGFRLTEQTDAQGNKQNYNYDATGNLRRVGTVTETNAAQTLVDLDRNGETGNKCTSITTDTGPKGTLRCSKDGNGHETRYEYNTKGELTKITPPSPSAMPLGALTFTYDTLSRPATMTDGKGQKRVFTYDLRDRVTKTEFFRTDGTLESTVTWVYDSIGNLSTRTDPKGTTTYGYNSRNLRTSEAFPGGRNNTYGYDAAKNLSSFTDGGGTVTYAYNDVNLLSQLTDPQAKITTFGYNDDNSRTTVTFPNGVVETMSHDRTERIKRIRATKGTSVLTDFEYSYAKGTGESNVRQKVIDHRDNTTTTWDYDHRGRMKQQRTTSNSTGTVTQSYTYRYDSNTNRLEATDSSNANPHSYAYNEANELCWVYVGTSSNGCSSPPTGATTFQYDRNGNTTSSSDGYSFAYNASNQTTSITPPGGSANAIGYFGVGQGEIESRTGETYSNSLLGLMQDGGERYVRDNQGQPLIWNDNGVWNYLLHDNHPGSTVAATDGAGTATSRYTYDPFGVVKSVSGSQSELLFADGQYHSGLKLYRFGERWYNPALGRWTQQDPLHRPFDPTDANRYAYVGGDPVNGADPSGLLTVSVDIDVGIPGTNLSVGGGVEVGDGGLGVKGRVGGGVGPGRGSIGINPSGRVRRSSGPVGGGCIGPSLRGPAACYQQSSSGGGSAGIGVGGQASIAHEESFEIL